MPKKSGASGRGAGRRFHVREDRAGNVAPARVSLTTEKENDKKRGRGRYPPLEIHPGDELGRASQAYARAVIDAAARSWQMADGRWWD